MKDRCKFCGEPIQWAVTDKGKNAPVQADPNGTLILLPAESGRALPRAMTVPVSPHGIEVKTIRYRLHLKVCTERGKR